MLRPFAGNVAAAAILLLSFPASARALEVADSLERDISFSNDVCEPVTRAVTLPRGARSIHTGAPDVGDRVDGPDGPAATITSVEEINRSGRAQIRVTATPQPAACVDPATGEITGWEDDGGGVAVKATFRRVTRVYFPQVCCGSRHDFKPRILYLGASFTLDQVRWRRWNGKVAKGTARLPANDCEPNCAQGTTTYYLVRVQLSRPRLCNGVYQYLTLRYSYRGRRPAREPFSSTSKYGFRCNE